ncbi:hypothetical protein VE01_10559 [Pseudogymnoascus verrucosus]|uniref:Short-chain dehydrogenase n=1 Tax=Pseudogymnoascus verrucosus TaxID=342668 RepID=A0A1B8G6K0_9PEZI|nr:uncharacterized protein VE01_10559 [Pseudogymnoascus verrucosus]OBT91469.1 hypothetical protein VE01_10559 [Pseudogymnoascus verrucosus]
MAWCFVSPASRGIGFALTRHLLQTTKAPILATSRSNTEDVRNSLLDGLKNVDVDRLTVLELDCVDEFTISTAADQARQMFPPETHHLRLAYAIPGVLHPERSPGQIDSHHALESFKVNTIGPLLILKHFCDFLPRKNAVLEGEVGLPERAVYASMGASVGSTTNNIMGGWYSYRASKAGVTSLAKSFDLYLQGVSGDNAISIAQHPGSVKTELSRDYWDRVEEDKLFSPELAAEKLVGVAGSVGLNGRGKFWDWRGEEVKP